MTEGEHFWTCHAMSINGTLLCRANSFMRVYYVHIFMYIFLNLCPKKKKKMNYRRSGISEFGFSVLLLKNCFSSNVTERARTICISKCVVVARRVQPKSHDDRTYISWTSYVWRRSCASDAGRTGTL